MNIHLKIIMDKQHWIIRVNDGINFKNSKYPFWGLKRKWLGYVKKIKKGDVLWFLNSKTYGGIFIGMAEYTGLYYDKKDEPLIFVNTITNKEQEWIGDESEWDIQIHYENLYLTEKQNISCIIQCASVILDYNTFKDKIDEDLNLHYKNYKFYAISKTFEN